MGAKDPRPTAPRKVRAGLLCNRPAVAAEPTHPSDTQPPANTCSPVRSPRHPA